MNGSTARGEHRLDVCPCCGGAIQRCQRKRTRVIENIPAEIASEVVEQTIRRDYCPAGKKHVEPIVPDAPPKAAVGRRPVALISWLHYGLGVSIEQVRSILGGHLHTELPVGGLVAAWPRTADILMPLHQQIAMAAKASGLLHADETGWQVDGKGHWLCCFANKLS